MTAIMNISRSPRQSEGQRWMKSSENTTNDTIIWILPVRISRGTIGLWILIVRLVMLTCRSLDYVCLILRLMRRCICLSPLLVALISNCRGKNRRIVAERRRLSKSPLLLLPACFVLHLQRMINTAHTNEQEALQSTQSRACTGYTSSAYKEWVNIDLSFQIISIGRRLLSGLSIISTKWERRVLICPIRRELHDLPDVQHSDQ
jgi:hypothetical protein